MNSDVYDEAGGVSVMTDSSSDSTSGAAAITEGACDRTGGRWNIKTYHSGVCWDIALLVKYSLFGTSNIYCQQI